MNPKLELEIRKALVILSEAFSKEVTPSLAAIYAEALSDLTVEQLQAATKRAVKSLKWFPKPAELRELSGGDNGATLSLPDRAQKAWAALDTAAEQVGGYRTVMFDDPIINACVRALGGWTYITELTCTEFSQFLHPKFLRAYESFARGGITDEQAAPLLGLHDESNSLMGQKKTEISLIKAGMPLLPQCKRFAPLIEQCRDGKVAIKHDKAKSVAPAIQFKQPTN